MDITEALKEIVQLPAEDRLRLVQAIWDSIVAEQDASLLTDEQMQVLSERLEFYRDNPNQLIPWDEVRRRAFEQLSQ